MITDPLFYCAAIPAILLMGISKGGFGSGVGILATPLVALTVPTPQAAAILLPILLVMDATGLWAYRGSWSRENMRLILPGGLAGVLLGTAVFGYASEPAVRLCIGSIALAFVAHRLLLDPARAAARDPSRPKGFFWSAVSGLTSTLAHAGGPPLSVYLFPLKLDKAVFVGTTVVFFAVINAAKVGPYLWLGLFDRSNLVTSLVLVPLAPLGIALGVACMKRVSQELFYRICYSALVVVGAKLVWDGSRALLAAT